MAWQERNGNWLLIPSRPRGVVHFLGGAFVAAAPQVTYRWLLEALYGAGYAVVATPFINTFDHEAIAEDVITRFEGTLKRLYSSGELSGAHLPIYGVGHSMGCKLHLLIGSTYEVARSGNILMAFNNYPASQAIPFFDQVAPNLMPFMAQVAPTLKLDLEFTPSPSETLRLVDRYYAVERNLLIKFRSDNIDQTRAIATLLERRFPQGTTLQRLNGNHLTPTAQDVQWQSRESFSPIDAMGQWMKQEFYRDINDLKSETLRWLSEG